MFAQFSNKGDFYNKYMQLYAMRQAMANLQMEDSETDILCPSRTQELYNNVIAFQNIIHKAPEKVSPYDLIDINADVNTGIYDRGFRKTQVSVKRAKKFFPPQAIQIAPMVYSTFDSYYNIWIDLPVFVKESKLHIELVRIQPFEDGNKRAARILTNYNLCHQNQAPVIIPGCETDEYFGYIDDYDVDGMAAFLEKKSKEELKIMMELYRSTVSDEVEAEVLEAGMDSDLGNVKVAKNLFVNIAEKTKKLLKIN